MKKIIALLLALCLLPLSSCAQEEKQPLALWEASDLHYLSSTLIEDETEFLRLVAHSDGKVTQYTPQIAQAFVADALAAHPDAVILSGDLTLNGAPQSHRELAELLRPLRDAGIPVLVMPGNHDTGSTAYRFTSQGGEAVTGTSAEEFAEFYADYGYAAALSRDEQTLSYMAELPGNVRVLMVDVNAGRTAGTVPDATLQWIEEQLKAAQKAGAEVIAVSHQSLLIHNPMFTFGYQINNAGALMELYSRYGVSLNLSGHLHLQSITEQEGITDIATASLAVTPNQYGVLTLGSHRSERSYETRPVEVSGWAAAAGQTDENLLDFAEYAAAFFDGCTYNKIKPQLDSITLTSEEREAMEDFALRLNREYFGGVAADFSADPAYALWQAHESEFSFAGYFAGILRGELTDQNHWNS